jgi:hypothetical protein
LDPREVKAEVYLTSIFSMFKENLTTAGEAKGKELNFEDFRTMGDEMATKFAQSLEASNEKKKERVNDLEISILLQKDEEEKDLSLKVSSDELAGLNMLLSRPFADSADINLTPFGSNDSEEQCWIAPGLVEYYFNGI